jgi:hypothetical protein
MSRQRVRFATGAVLAAAAFLLMAHQALAGPAARAGTGTATTRQPTPTTSTRVASAAINITVAETPARPAAQPFTIGLRGPDGQVRRFPVEGGRETIQVRSVTLRAGESLTIRWTPAK